MTDWQTRANELKQGKQVKAIRVMDEEFDNVRAAWDWALNQRNYEALDGMIDVVYTYCTLRGWIDVGTQLFEQARQKLAPEDGDTPHPTWGRVLVRFRQFDANHLDLIERGLVIARQHQNIAEEAFCLHQKGWQVDHDEAPTVFEQSKALYEKINDQYHVAHNLMAMANIALRNGRGNDALQALKTAEGITRAIGDEDGLAFVLGSLGMGNLGAGKYSEAENYYRQAYKIYKKIGNQSQIISLEGYTFAVIALQTTADTSVEPAVNRFLEHAKYYHLPVSQATAHAILSMIALLREDYDHCLALVNEALPWIGDGYIHQMLMRSWASANIALGNYNEIPSVLVKRVKYYCIVPARAELFRDFSHYAAWLAHQGESEKAQLILSFALQHPASPSGYLTALPWLKKLNIITVASEMAGYTIDSLVEEMLQLEQ